MKNRLPTNENDVADAIETAASTNNEGKEEDSIPVVLVDKVESFEDGFEDDGPVTIRFQYLPVPVQQQQQPKPKRTYNKSRRKQKYGQYPRPGITGKTDSKRSKYLPVKRQPAAASTKKKSTKKIRIRNWRNKNDHRNEKLLIKRILLLVKINCFYQRIRRLRNCQS